MADDDFKIGEHTYRISTIPTMTQLEIARRYSAVLVFIGDVKAKTAALPQGVTAEAMGKALLLAAAQVEAGDQQFVISACMAAVYRLEGEKALPVQDRASGRLQFEADMNPVIIAEIVYRVLERHGLIDFFVDRPPSS